MQQIADWLEKLGLSEYTARFADTLSRDTQAAARTLGLQLDARSCQRGDRMSAQT